MKKRELATRYFRLVVALHAHRRGDEIRRDIRGTPGRTASAVRASPGPILCQPVGPSGRDTSCVQPPGARRRLGAPNAPGPFHAHPASLDVRPMLKLEQITPKPCVTGIAPGSRFVRGCGPRRPWTRRSVTVRRNDVLEGLNNAERFILAILRVDGDRVGGPQCVRARHTRQPDVGAASLDYTIHELLARAKPPHLA